MLRLSCNLRVYARRGAPVVAMTATAKSKEIRQVVALLHLAIKPVVMVSGPVLSYHKYTILVRPPVARGLMGTVDRRTGNLRPGLWHMLGRLYIYQFIRDLKIGVKSKRCIIYFRDNVQLGAVYRLLQQITGQFDPCTAAFMMNHSSLLPADDITLQARREGEEEVTLYLASNKMLLGTDLKRIDVVIFTRPFDMAAALVQGAGRMSRRTALGYRTAGQVYLLWNGSDLSSEGMSEDMRQICRQGVTTCTKEILQNIYSVDPDLSRGEQVAGEVEQVAASDAKKKEKAMKKLKQQIATCTDHAQLMRLLQADAEMGRRIAEVPGVVEHGVAAAAGGVRGNLYCCHFCDLQNSD